MFVCDNLLLIISAFYFSINVTINILVQLLFLSMMSVLCEMYVNCMLIEMTINIFSSYYNP